MEKATPEYTGKTQMFLEVDNAQYELGAVMEKAKADYKANNKGKLTDIKLYVKPEDGKAYYTANGGKISGSVDL
ncbi:MAG: hypothetical protein IKR23_05725 [Lachnospiraceae bacterium]|nr:hypothetical protein [Lachnospiraceae bacterium]